MRRRRQMTPEQQCCRVGSIFGEILEFLLELLLETF